MEIVLKRTLEGLAPDTLFEAERLQKIAIGKRVLCDIKQPRNVDFHRKFHSLVRYLYSIWEPPEAENKHGKAEKCYDTFRHDLTILAGYYTQTIRLNGDIQVTAKSISFAKMNEEEFQELYSKVIDVALNLYAKQKGYDYDTIVDNLMEYVG